MRASSSALPYAIACVGIALFSVMDAYMKGLSIALGAYNAMLWRVIVGAAIGGACFFAVRSPLPSRQAMRLHVKRSAVAAVMAVAFFWGIARVPLAEGIALSFIAPVITLYLAAVLLDERIGRNAILASVFCSIGVGVMLAARLGVETYDAEAIKGSAAILVSAVLYAYNLILQRQQAQLAKPLEIAFFQSLVVAAILGLFSPFLAVFPASSHWPDIVMSAVLAMASLLLLSWAYARAEAQLLVSVEYTAFVWAAIFGWLFFAERLTATTLIGTGLIVAGCIIATRQRPDHIEQIAL